MITLGMVDLKVPTQSPKAAKATGMYGTNCFIGGMTMRANAKAPPPRMYKKTIVLKTALGKWEMIVPKKKAVM